MIMEWRLQLMTFEKSSIVKCRVVVREMPLCRLLTVSSLPSLHETKTQPGLIKFIAINFNQQQRTKGWQTGRGSHTSQAVFQEYTNLINSSLSGRVVK
jgi:hypothetical protein